MIGTQRHLMASLGMLVLLACGNPSVDGLTLKDGRRLKDLLSADSQSVAVLLHPQECLQCLTSLSRRLVARRTAPEGKLVFILSRPPSEQEVIQLRLHRIQYEGELVGRIPINGLSGLHALVFRAGSLVSSIDVRRTETSDSLIRTLGLGT